MLKTIIALVFSLIVLVFFAGLSIFLYILGIEDDSNILVLISYALMPIGLYLVYMVFKYSRKAGAVNFMTSVNASPDLDNLNSNN